MPWEHAPNFVQEMLKIGIVYFQIGYRTIHILGGPQAIRDTRSWGGKVIYDARLHAKAETIGESIRAIAENGVTAVSVHTSLSKKALEAAVASAGDMSILGVTASSDLNAEEFREVYGLPPCRRVPNLARRALEIGFSALICSPQDFELGSISRISATKIASDMCPNWAPRCDEPTLTPAVAVQKGADCIIINRPLYYGTYDLEHAIRYMKRVIREIEQTLATRT